VSRVAIPLRMTYAAYISSEVWRERRVIQLENDGHRCQGCGGADDLHVHHVTYDRLGNEAPGDLVTVCEVCHGFIHREQQRSLGSLAQVTDAVLGQIRVSGKTAPSSWTVPAHTPRHMRGPSDWRQDARGGGTWARSVPHRDEALAARRANGLSVDIDRGVVIRVLGNDSEEG
jgi:hypothetical protein